MLAIRLDSTRSKLLLRVVGVGLALYPSFRTGLALRKESGSDDDIIESAADRGISRGVRAGIRVLTCSAKRVAGMLVCVHEEGQARMLWDFRRYPWPFQHHHTKKMKDSSAEFVGGVEGFWSCSPQESGSTDD
jgi:hypothetical protein